MKYLFFITLIVFNSFASPAQNIGISDFIKISKLNDSEIEAYLNDKGCKIQDIKEDEFGVLTKYYNSKAQYWIGIYSFKDGCKIISSDFQNMTFYNLQKKEVLNIGYKYTKSEIIKEKISDNGNKYKSIEYVYEKGNEEISFFTQIFQTNIQYEIAFHKNCELK